MGKPDYRVDEATGCWIWQRGKTGPGYGWYTADGAKKQRGAHRVYYERLKGPIPEGRFLDHLCGNRACVNPDHLEPVTHAENNRRGGLTKLTPEQVEEIRASDETVRALGARFGVHNTHISRIKNGRNWA